MPFNYLTTFLHYFCIVISSLQNSASRIMAKYYFDVLEKESTSLYSVFLFFFLFFCLNTSASLSTGTKEPKGQGLL